MPGSASRLGEEEKKVPFLRAALVEVTEQIKAASLRGEDISGAAQPLSEALQKLDSLIPRVETSTLSASRKEELLSVLHEKQGQAEAALNLAMNISLEAKVVAPEGPATGRAASARRLGFAWRTVGQHPGAPVVVTLMVAQAFVRGCLNVLIVVAAFELLDGGGGTVGALTAAIGAGGVVGAVVSSTLRSRRLARIFALSLFGWGIPIVLFAPSPQLFGALVLLAIVGASNSIEDVSGFTLLQRAIRDDALSGVLGLIWAIASYSIVFGILFVALALRLRKHSQAAQET